MAQETEKHVRRLQNGGKAKSKARGNTKQTQERHENQHSTRNHGSKRPQKLKMGAVQSQSLMKPKSKLQGQSLAPSMPLMEALPIVSAGSTGQDQPPLMPILEPLSMPILVTESDVPSRSKPLSKPLIKAPALTLSARIEPPKPPVDPIRWHSDPLSYPPIMGEDLMDALKVPSVADLTLKKHRIEGCVLPDCRGCARDLDWVHRRDCANEWEAKTFNNDHSDLKPDMYELLHQTPWNFE